MFVPLRQVHRFSDIGYTHLPFVQQLPSGLPPPSVASAWDVHGWPACPPNPATASAPFGISDGFDFWQWTCSSNSSAVQHTPDVNVTVAGTPHKAPARGVIFSVVRRDSVPMLMQLLRSLYRHFFRNVYASAPADAAYPVVIFETDWTAREEKAVRQYVSNLQQKDGAAMTLRVQHVSWELPPWLEAKGDVPERTTCTPANSAIRLRHMNRFRSMQVHQLLAE